MVRRGTNRELNTFSFQGNNMSMKDIVPTDLTGAAMHAAALVHAVDAPLVLCGALAMAAWGYQRETHDVDIVVPVVIGAASGDKIEAAAKQLGLDVRARHSFGGLDLRFGNIRIDVLTLDRDIPALIPEAVAEAVASNRRVMVFGQKAYVISLGHLITMKLLAERAKDKGDVVELIKMRIDDLRWLSDDRAQVVATVQRHLGWYSVRTVDTLEQTARAELHL